MADLTEYCSCVLELSGCGWVAPPPTYPPTEEKWLAIAYAVSVFCVVAFAVYAIIVYTLYMRKMHRDQTAEEFCTAKGTQSGWRIGYSFFATAVGAWCIAAPPYFAVNNGILGLVMYAIASGMPVFILAICGARVTRRFPGVSSVGDFAGQRFGPTFRTIVVLITLFNMGIAMTAEYTTIGSLFKDFVGSMNWPIIITIGIVTMTYTMYGGLYISIVTDQVQAIVTITFITILSVYVAVTFREPLPKPLPNNTLFEYDPVTGYINFPLGVNKLGYSTIFSMPCALMASTVFSEAVWQKVWASANRRALIFGGTLGFSLITTAVFLFGFAGWLAAWAGYINWNTNTNLYLFQVLRGENSNDFPPPAPPAPNFPGSPPAPPLAPSPPLDSPFAPPNAPFGPPFDPLYNGQSARMRSWIGVITLVLAVIMNEGAVDSLQNGITSCISVHFFRNQHIMWTRVVVACINIPCIIIATKSLNALQLFLIANMLTTCWFLPVLTGLWDCTAGFVGETGAIFGGCVALLTTFAYSIGKYWKTAGGGYAAIQCGSWYAWYGDYNYDWDQFLVAACASVAGMILWAVPAYLLRRFFGIHGPGVSGVLGYLPGFKFITGSGLDCDLMQVVGLGRFSDKTKALEDSTQPSFDKAKAMEAAAENSGSFENVIGKPADEKTAAAEFPEDVDGAKAAAYKA